MNQPLLHVGHSLQERNQSQQRNCETFPNGDEYHEDDIREWAAGGIGDQRPHTQSSVPTALCEKPRHPGRGRHTSRMVPGHHQDDKCKGSVVEMKVDFEPQSLNFFWMKIRVWKPAGEVGKMKYEIA